MARRPGPGRRPAGRPRRRRHGDRPRAEPCAAVISAEKYATTWKLRPGPVTYQFTRRRPRPPGRGRGLTAPQALQCVCGGGQVPLAACHCGLAGSPHRPAVPTRNRSAVRVMQALPARNGWLYRPGIRVKLQRRVSPVSPVSHGISGISRYFRRGMGLHVIASAPPAQGTPGRPGSRAWTRTAGRPPLLRIATLAAGKSAAAARARHDPRAGASGRPAGRREATAGRGESAPGGCGGGADCRRPIRTRRGARGGDRGPHSLPE